MKWLLLTMVAACGGAPFELGTTATGLVEGGPIDPVPDPLMEAGPQPHDGARLGVPRLDGGVAIEAASIEASIEAGAVEAEASPPPPADAAEPPEAEAAPTCTPIAPYASTCGPNLAVVTAPTQYCLNVGATGSAASTPIACRCAETFTCACLGSVCPNGHPLLACGVGHGPALRVDCQ